jgi:hypothetical protein
LKAPHFGGGLSLFVLPFRGDLATSHFEETLSGFCLSRRHVLAVSSVPPLQ